MATHKQTEKVVEKHIQELKPNELATGQTAMTQENERVKVTELSDEEKKKLLNEHKTWSGVFRALDAQGKTKGEISKLTGKRYQHVRNVLITPLTNKQAVNA